MTSIIRVVDVSKRFNIHKDKSIKERLVNLRRSRQHAEAFWALRDVDLDVAAGSTLGLIGHNGSGKSTLLKVIGGILVPSTGYVERRGRLAALLELGAGFHGDLTGRENVYLNASILGLTRRQTEAYFDAIVEFSGIPEFIDTQVKFYSSGMYVRLAFAVAVHVDPEILLVDEVLAVGDEPFQRKCLEKIKEFQRDGRTIVLVTHGLDTVRQMCDRAVMLEHGRVVAEGTPLAVTRAFRERYDDAPGLAQGVGDRRLEIISARSTDLGGRPQDRFTAGDPMAIELDVVAHQPTSDWAAGISISNSAEVLAYGTNTVLQGRVMPPLDSTTTVRFAFEQMPLTEGQYYVTVAVHPVTGPEYHRLDRNIAFRVVSEAGDVGVVYMTPKIATFPTARDNVRGALADHAS